MCDSVVTVMRMSPMIPVEPITHVDQFFSHYQFYCARGAGIYALQVDQDCMLPAPTDKTVCSTIRGGHESSNPLAVRCAVRRDHQRVSGKGEQRNIPIDQAREIGVAIIENQNCPTRCVLT